MTSDKILENLESWLKTQKLSCQLQVENSPFPDVIRNAKMGLETLELVEQKIEQYRKSDTG